MPACIAKSKKDGSLRLISNAPVSNSTRYGLSISPFSELMFGTGVTFKIGSETATSLFELQSIYKRKGSTEVFARVSTQRYNQGWENESFHSLENALERAKLAKQLDLPLNVEVGAIRVYGDINCQPPPDFREYPSIALSKPWHTMELNEMEQSLYAYGEFVAKSFADNGYDVSIWDIGNEVDFGFAGVAATPNEDIKCRKLEGADEWNASFEDSDLKPIREMTVKKLFSMNKSERSERVNWLQTNVWPYSGKLMLSLVQGIRSVFPRAKFSTHIALSDDPELSVAFYRTMQNLGLPFDYAGFSYYPSMDIEADLKFARFKESVAQVKGQLGLNSFIAEFAYPSRAATGNGSFSKWTHEVTGYAISMDGQKRFIEDLVNGRISNHIIGIRPWAPDLLFPGWDFLSYFQAKEGNVTTANTVLN